MVQKSTLGILDQDAQEAVVSASDKMMAMQLNYGPLGSGNTSFEAIDMKHVNALVTADGAHVIENRSNVDPNTRVTQMNDATLNHGVHYNSENGIYASSASAANLFTSKMNATPTPNALDPEISKGVFNLS